MLALAVAPSIGWAFPIGAVMGMASIGFLTASTAIVQTKAAPEMRGRVLALQAMVFLGSTPIGGPIVGYVSEHLGPRYAIAMGGFAGVGAAAWGAMTIRGDRPEPAEPADLEVPVPETP
jgi:MFS family permease